MMWAKEENYTLHSLPVLQDILCTDVLFMLDNTMIIINFVAHEVTV